MQRELISFTSTVVLYNVQLQLLVRIVIKYLKHIITHKDRHGDLVAHLVDLTPFVRKGHGFESRSNRHVGNLDMSFTRSCLWRFSVKLRHSIRAVSGAPLSSSGLEEAL